MSNKRKYPATSSRTNSDSKIIQSWLTLALQAMNSADWYQVEELLQKILDISPKHARALQLMGQAQINAGAYIEGLNTLERAVSVDPGNAQNQYLRSFALERLRRLAEALEAIDQALAKVSDNEIYLAHKAMVLQGLNREAQALDVLNGLLEQHPHNARYWNNASNLHNILGQPEKARECLQKAAELAPQNAYIFSNLITNRHYNPQETQASIYEACLEWDKLFPPAPSNTQTDPVPSRVLRLGMISEGFQFHPVGQMIIAALERLPGYAYEFYAYSMFSGEDAITRRFKKICNYRLVNHITDDALADQIRADQIDILIDMAGHHSGSRMLTLTQKPAPIQIKWVGGLINTSGSEILDYLLSDRYETPEGTDSMYTEKLVRLPGDYICYEPPSYLPEESSLPAKQNGYITFGSFNNGMKVNAELIEQWAGILGAVPNSRLFLKSKSYGAPEFCEKILTQFEEQGIVRERVILEGVSPHPDLLKCYHRVDIALDTWPYSGGLTTCEAFIMGVPVVTMPGPTFAGRHSTTHLINAGMPELVTHSWEEYRDRAIELASDVDSLAVIRTHLREVLQKSPVCDAASFAGHLNNALRAIWQRHCESKTPAALNFNENGEVLFQGESEPVILQHPEPPPEDEARTYRWEFEGKVIAIDHGAQLFGVPVIKQMLEQGTLELIAFDPASNKLKHPLRQAQGVHYYPNILLGSGSPATLYACQDAKLSGTLKPKGDAHFTEKLKNSLTTLAELPINTLELDKVSELPAIDWLILDNLNNSVEVLEHGSEALKDTLLIQTDIVFQATHDRQPNLAEVSHWAARHGFRFYCLNQEESRTPVPQNIIGANNYADELVSATALFIPSHERMESLSTNQRRKLAFIADTVFSLEGLGYEVLGRNSDEEAEKYIQYKVRQEVASKQPHVPASGVRQKPRLMPTQAPSPEPTDTGAETTSTSIKRPDLTLPTEVAKYLKKVYSDATCILEYGSGGSTVLASEMENKQVFTVENDLNWAANIVQYLEQAAPPSPAIIHTVNVGKTGPWAYPINDSSWRNFHKYPLSVWDRDDFTEPDVILIDGRFRVACFVAAVMKIRKPTIVLFDDYGDRPYYHVVERLAKPVTMVGRMAHFELTPGNFPPEELTWMIASFNQVTYSNLTRP
ncbi:tetratricopeptide repeat protein [Marinobacterium mangrovicola]|uniref:protein O-GlcNAc transferase n=1 Tax=Marinobacterium mangrovicola TaxID=1476959 RepID=A0A4R1GG84_9GAMM|nr:tetratricopeptide repeat protein [Marinobacterium mangrovicola]TCK07048.1 putative O-linked N-acetylglucosamine transferase (SPINDLY family) [Marinobacterium mangrovicola]